MEWHLTLDDGVGIDEAIAGLVERFPHQAELIRAYKSRWLDTIPGAIDGTVAILEALVAKGHDVTALSNFNQDLFRDHRAAYPFLELFRGVTVSGEQRMMKPDPGDLRPPRRGVRPRRRRRRCSSTIRRRTSMPRVRPAGTPRCSPTPEKMREDLAR